MRAPVLVWLRLDLRLRNNPALTAAAAQRQPVIPVFIWAPEEEDGWQPGAASRWWLHRSLESLQADLKKLGSRLILRRGSSLGTLRSLVRETGADAVFWNRRYEPALRRRDAQVQQSLRADGIKIETYNSALLFEPDEIKNSAGQPFRVFTAFWKACLTATTSFTPESAPSSAKAPPLSSLSLDELALEPGIDWAAGLRSTWQPGESGAQKRMRRFFDDALDGYPEQRDYPSYQGTSRLSPHLHFGEISPHQIWAACPRHRSAASKAFLRQLGWREFAHHLLYHFPHTARAPLRPQFSHFPWRCDSKGLHAWQQGQTGYPIVDAGMRELWTTGWMHNRVRMIVGSFLVKDLLLSWMNGARWFWDTLVDADLANNTLGWQWVAGCGADAAPFFRIFNPTSQAARFDPKGDYIRKWIPELNTAGYPQPVVDHARARVRALDALSAIKQR
jgi:deoxyribodipyrimidine photo-lyase